jgi:hypothetical protein
VVPLHQLADGDETVTREIRGSHKGVPMLEAAFEIRF